MFIHRSTFLYRLDRIKEILQSELDDPEEIFYLELSFRLLEHCLLYTSCQIRIGEGETCVVETLDRAGNEKILTDGFNREVVFEPGLRMAQVELEKASKRGTIYAPVSVGFTGGRIVCTSAGSEVLYHEIGRASCRERV